MIFVLYLSELAKLSNSDLMIDYEYVVLYLSELAKLSNVRSHIRS